MIQEVLKAIEGVAIFPMIGLFLFVGGFIVIIVITWRMKAGDVDYLSRLPLDHGGVAENTTDDDRESGRMQR